MKTNSLRRETGLRHVWLAGLGAVSVLRRKAMNASDRARTQASRLQRRAFLLTEEVKSQVVAGADTARGHFDPILDKVNSAFGLRLSALAKLGLRPARRAGRKPAAKTPRRAEAVQPRRSVREA